MKKMKKSIENKLMTRWAGKSIYYYEETDSTNTQAKQLKQASHGTLVVADRQTSGRGRLGRSWESPAGNSIYMSLRLHPEIAPDQAPMLTLVMALSVAEAVEMMISNETEKKENRMHLASGSPMSGVKLCTEIKWPNDIILNKKKICGILTEMSCQMVKKEVKNSESEQRMLNTSDSNEGFIYIPGIEYVIIGVGVNVNTTHFPEEIQTTATSLYQESGQTFERSALIAEILKRFEENYETFLETKDLSGLIDSYNARLVNKEKQVRVLEPGHEYNGYALGINEKGELLVRKEDGSIENIYAGEVSVRGLYGYV